MTTSEYTVRLDAFEGPLDLLLFLIRRAEVEVTDIPIAQITDQYLRHIEDLADPHRGARLDIERAGEFLVMAATLMEIKSRTLAPAVAAAESGGIEGVETAARPQTDQPLDPRAELIQQLLEYKRFRDAGDQLIRFKREWEGMYPAGRALAPRPDVPPTSGSAEVDAVTDPDAITGPVDLDDIELIDLVEAFGRIIETVDLTRVGEHRVVMDDTPVEIHAEDIVDQLKRRAELPGEGEAGELDFAAVFENRTRAEMIGLFLAVLELVKQQRIWVRQAEDDASGRRIVLKLAAIPEASPAPSAEPPDPSAPGAQ